MKQRDILIISTADWDSPIQTNKQYVTKELAKLGYRVIYIESLGMRKIKFKNGDFKSCLLYTSPSPRDKRQSRMPSSA